MFLIHSKGFGQRKINQAKGNNPHYKKVYLNYHLSEMDWKDANYNGSQCIGVVPPPPQIKDPTPCRLSTMER